MDKRIDHSKDKKIEEFTFLRGFAVLAVIAIHTTGYFTKIESFNVLVLLNLWIDMFSQFAVPLFILISGFVLARKYYKNYSVSKFYKNRIRSIIPQYLLFSILYTVFNNWTVIKTNPLSTTFSLLLNNIWNANASYHLWFFLIIIPLYLLYPLVIKIYIFFKNSGKAEFLIALLFVIQMLWMVGLHTSSFPFIKINFISFLFYFGLGIYVNDRFEQLKEGIKHQTPLFLTISLALTLGSSFFIIIGLTLGYDYYSIPSYFFIGLELVYPILKISTFLLLLNLASSLVIKRGILTKVVKKFGDYSFGIYLIHIFFIQITIEMLKNNAVDYSDWLFYPIVFLVTVITSYLAVRLISYLPHSYYIIGTGRK